MSFRSRDKIRNRVSTFNELGFECVPLESSKTDHMFYDNKGKKRLLTATLAIVGVKTKTDFAAAEKMKK